jgi:hypothetical protein
MGMTRRDYRSQAVMAQRVTEAAEFFEDVGHESGNRLHAYGAKD